MYQICAERYYLLDRNHQRSNEIVIPSILRHLKIWCTFSKFYFVFIEFFKNVVSIFFHTYISLFISLSSILGAGFPQERGVNLLFYWSAGIQKLKINIFVKRQSTAKFLSKPFLFYYFFKCKFHFWIKIFFNFDVPSILLAFNTIFVFFMLISNI